MSVSSDKSISLDTDTLQEQYAGEEKIITGDHMSFQ